MTAVAACRIAAFAALDDIAPRHGQSPPREYAGATGQHCGARRKAAAELFGGAHPRSRGHTVLLPGAAAHADRTDDLAADDDRNAAFRRHRLLRKGRESG